MTTTRDLRREAIPVKSCTFFEYSDLVGPFFSQRQSDLIAESLNNSEISFGSNNRTMVSPQRFYEIIRSTDGIEPDEANAICEKLQEVLEPTDYIDVEN